MIEVFKVFAASARPVAVPELITLLTTLVALFVAMERLVNAVSRAIRALREGNERIEASAATARAAERRSRVREATRRNAKGGGRMIHEGHDGRRADDPRRGDKGINHEGAKTTKK